MKKLIFTFSFLSALNPIFSQTLGNGVTDIEGNTYPTVIIGDQEWMAENLRVEKYNNGDLIQNVVSNTNNAWNSAGANFGAWCTFPNVTNYETLYGKLYNWLAVVDSRKLCPSGWRAPSDSDFADLVNYLDPTSNSTVQNGIESTIAGGKLKATGTLYWLSPNTGATNSTGFSARGAGVRGGPSADYYYLKTGSEWWTTSSQSTYNVIARSVEYLNANISRNVWPQETGLSVRCMRDYCLTSTPTGTSTQTFCGGSTIANLLATGTAIKWYSSSNGGSQLSNTTPLVNGSTYYATQTVNGCESQIRFPVLVSIINTSQPTGTSSQTFCNSATVNNLSATGTSIQWYNAASGGTALASSTALVTGQTYYATQTENNCESQQRLAVSVTINSPAAPTGLATQNFCNSATVGDLSATGANIQWFYTSTGGTPLATSTVLGNGNYFASQTINNCESANRLIVTVSVFSNPNTSVILNGNTLTASQQGETYQWLNCDNNLSPISGENQMYYTPLVSGNYAVLITLNGCTNTSNCTYVQVSTGSIDENEDSFIINLYPNPNSGTFTFETTLTGKYLVMNNLGQIIAEFNVDYPSQKEVNLDKPSKGVYYIKHTENQARPTKLIVH